MAKSSEQGILKCNFTPSDAPEAPYHQSIITALSLIPHIEGGYFVQTDADEATIPSPYPVEPLSEATMALARSVGALRPDYYPALRRLSTTIFYYLTPRRPIGAFHVNRSRIVHSLQKGRAMYVLVYPDTGKIETFIVGQNVEAGERLQWVVEGGVWKGTFLLENEADKMEEEMLISEVVVPGFEFADHEFISMDQAKAALPKDKVEELSFLVRPDPQ